MKNLRITVADKIATYQKRDGFIVCGNSDYQLVFTFDEEWDAFPEKKARFNYSGMSTDVPFTGDTCPVPILRNTELVSVGVYAGDLCTTTPADIPCVRSILCRAGKLTEGDQKATTVAELYAEKAAESAAAAQADAEIARQFASNTETIEASIERNSRRITNLEQGVTPDPFETDDSVAYEKAVPVNALPYAEVTRIGGMTKKSQNLWKPKPGVSSFELSGVTVTVENGVYTLNGTSTGSAQTYIQNGYPLPAGTYTLRCYTEGETPSGGNVNVYGGTLSLASTFNVSNNTKTDELEVDGPVALRMQLNTGAVYNNFKVKPMLTRGTTAQPFEPFFEGMRDVKPTQLVSKRADGTTLGTLVIPEAVRALDGYGLGVDSTHTNRIEYDEDGKCTFVKAVREFTYKGLDTEYIAPQIVGDHYTLFTLSVDYKTDATKHPPLSDDTPAVINWDTPHKHDYNVSSERFYVNVNGLVLVVSNDKATTEAGLKTYLAANPLRLVYALATPEVTPVSTRATPDNLIKVEGGGTVIVENEHGLSAPSSITYMLKGV